MSEHPRTTHEDGIISAASATTPAGASMTEHDIDAAIDAVAREMTQLEPPSALRVEIMDRIERRYARRGLAWWVLTAPRGAWTAAAAILAVMVATGVWVERGDILPVPDELANLSAPPPAPQPPPDPTRSSDGLSASAGAANAPAAQTAPARRRASQAVAAPRVRTPARAVEMLPALAELEPLQFADVGPDALDVAGVDVAPLSAIPSLDIPRLQLESTDVQTVDPKKEK